MWITVITHEFLVRALAYDFEPTVLKLLYSKIGNVRESTEVSQK